MISSNRITKSPAMIDELVEVCARDVPVRAAWASGLTVRLPAALVLLLEQADGDWDNDDLCASTASAADDLRMCAALTETPPASSRLAISYRAIPAPARRLLAGAIGRWQRTRVGAWSKFPGWPLDLS